MSYSQEGTGNYIVVGRVNNSDSGVIESNSIDSSDDSDQGQSFFDPPIQNYKTLNTVRSTIL